MTARELPGHSAKTATKKVAKKAAKKVAKKAGKKGAKGPGHHLRRGYEHLHRLRILVPLLAEDAMSQVHTLSQFAQVALGQNDERTAADLLRAAEHIAFGSAASEAGDTSLTEGLTEAATNEYDHLLDRAAAAWDVLEEKPARAISGIYTGSLRSAKSALRAGAYHRALEFARAADAIAHAAPVGLRLTRGAGAESSLLLES